MRRLPIAVLQERVERVLIALGVAPERAKLGARLTVETDRDGVRTHGIARVPRFAQWARDGVLDPTATPVCVSRFGGMERWRGRRGPGNLAAHAAMGRAMELADVHGLGCVALGETSHWMRAGTYGWQAAEAGMAAMCWTNTMPNLPPWGAKSAALGNNPLVVAIPRMADGAAMPIVLDMAMSQFSYGTLASYRERGQQLPVVGGFDEDGQLTTDPGAIERTQRALPVGFWKGSGLSFVLDVLAAMLSGGLATHQIPPDPSREIGISQVFLAVAPQRMETMEELSRVAKGAIDALHAATPIVEGEPVRYPGEGTLRVREESLRLGVGVTEAAWEAFVRLEAELG